MKKIFLLSVLLTSVFADKISWMSYQDAIKKHDKPMFVFYSRDNCGYCKESLEDMNTNGTFKRYLKENFNAVYYDAASGKELYAPVTPTIFILTEKGNKIDGIDAIYGYQNIVDEMRYMNKSLYIYEHLKSKN